MKTALFVLISFIALTALISGLIMITNPDGAVLNLSVSLLDGTAFKNFKIPGILLTALVGGTNLLAVFFLLLRNRNRYNWSMAGGIIIIGWIIAQMVLLGTVYWIHFLYLGIGVLIVLISYQLKGKWAA